MKIYTLSTCGWCRKLKKLLNALEVDYDYTDVDKLSGEELKKVREEVKQYNPRGSFPTLVINDGEHVVVGFNEDMLTKVICECYGHPEEKVKGEIAKC